MELQFPLFIHGAFTLFLLCQFPLPSCSQQSYQGRNYLNCFGGSIDGYLCNGPVSCVSYIAFRARAPYNYPASIARHLGAETSEIVRLNKVPETKMIARDTLIIVPVSCSCWGNVYQHFPPFPYILKTGDSYFTIANASYQGLASCKYVINQNYFSVGNGTNLTVGSGLMIPLRCACAAYNQSANALLVYMVDWGDTVSKIGKRFRVPTARILEANMLSENSIIYPFTPMLVPMKYEKCSVNPSFLCVPDNEGSPIKLITLIGVSVGFGLLCFVLLGYKLHKYLKERKSRIRKEKLFKQNGGLLLKQQCSFQKTQWRGKLFSEEELIKATDNYNQSRFLGQGGYGIVYKGMLLDGTIVAVKRAKAIDRSQIDQFINEVVILSQINHRNVVKLLGSCLETEFPLLVYEFIPNGTLSSHIHQPNPEHSLSWDDRLRIASEVAGAVAYMHSATSLSIFHRDIKSSNILLDDRYTAKVSDFGTSRSLTTDKTHLTTGVKGTFGYLDPEYFQSSQYTDKSDVYSFGVVLLELLTGEKPISFSRDVSERNLATYFRTSVMENRLLGLLDPRVAKEAKKDDIFATADLAMRCLRSNGKERPTMREVTMELEVLRKDQRGSQACRDIQALKFETNEESSIIFSSEWESMST